MADTVLSAHQLCKVYATRTKSVRALHNLDVTIEKGQIVAIVGESGSGKSTFGELVLGIQSPTSGDILYRDKPMPRRRPASLKRLIQFVPQNPLSALNPRRSIFQSVSLPLQTHGIGDPTTRRDRVADLLGLVGLPPDIMDRKPRVLSGGQRQRVAIARALSAEPEIIVFDEPTSALDVSVQARVIRLLVDLHQRFSLTYVFITHDLAVARILADRVIVLYKGEMVEHGPTAAVLRRPRHRYTQLLLSSLPVVSEEEERLKPSWPFEHRVQVETAPSNGCLFSARCPFATRECVERMPDPRLFTPDHMARCFNPAEGPDPP